MKKKTFTSLKDFFLNIFFDSQIKVWFSIFMQMGKSVLKFKELFKTLITKFTCNIKFWKKKNLKLF